MDMQDMLDLFYSDSEINNLKTMVCGNDLCEMLGLFHDLAEASRTLLMKKSEDLEKYKIAYNNRVRRDKKQAEAKKKEANENDGYVKELRTHNTTLLMKMKELQE